MNICFKFTSKLKNQKGVTAVVVGISIFMFIGFVALAIDLGHLYVVKNELQNAADAGALAGAAVLYDDQGTSINVNANQTAYEAARANGSEGVPVELYNCLANSCPEKLNPNLPEDQKEDVQRGHWSFGSGSLARGFYCNDSTVPVTLPGVSDTELDENEDFINAVKVVTRRTRRELGTPVLSFFARIFGYEDFELKAEAVAYRGFTGSLGPGELDQPIAICQDSILKWNEEGEASLDCTIGRMINSGQNVANQETGGWTDFNQDDPCSGGTNAQIVKSLVCGDGNPGPLVKAPMATNGGEIQSAFNDLVSCWKSAYNDLDDDGLQDNDEPSIDSDGDGIPDVPWNLTLPVVKCLSNNLGPCDELVGAVNLNIIWIVAQNDPQYKEVPKEMYEHPDADVLNNDPEWPNEDDLDDPPSNDVLDIMETFDDFSLIDSKLTDQYGNWRTLPLSTFFSSDQNYEGAVRWASFVEYFDLINISEVAGQGTYAPYQNKAIYFKPDCEVEELAGVSGGPNFGVLARIPVLVK